MRRPRPSFSIVIPKFESLSSPDFEFKSFQSLKNWSKDSPTIHHPEVIIIVFFFITLNYFDYDIHKHVTISSKIGTFFVILITYIISLCSAQIFIILHWVIWSFIYYLRWCRLFQLKRFSSGSKAIHYFELFTKLLTIRETFSLHLIAPAVMLINDPDTPGCQPCLSS